MLEEDNKKLCGGAALPGLCVHAGSHSLCLSRELTDLEEVTAVSLRGVQTKPIALVLTVCYYRVGKDR